MTERESGQVSRAFFRGVDACIGITLFFSAWMLAMWMSVALFGVMIVGLMLIVGVVSIYRAIRPAPSGSALAMLRMILGVIMLLFVVMIFTGGDWR